MKCDIPGWSCSERKPEYHHNLEVLNKQPIMNDSVERAAAASSSKLMPFEQE